MNTPQTLHREAMSLAEQADLYRLQGKKAAARLLVEKAFFKEKQAAELAVSQHHPEPSRSVLLRSAASLAMECQFWPQARQLTKKALQGDPPQEIKAELQELLGGIPEERPRRPLVKAKHPRRPLKAKYRVS